MFHKNSACVWMYRQKQQVYSEYTKTWPGKASCCFYVKRAIYVRQSGSEFHRLQIVRQAIHCMLPNTWPDWHGNWKTSFKRTKACDKVAPQAIRIQHSVLGSQIMCSARSCSAQTTAGDKLTWHLATLHTQPRGAQRAFGAKSHEVKPTLHEDFQESKPTVLTLDPAKIPSHKAGSWRHWETSRLSQF